jgi:hypothetical protein
MKTPTREDHHFNPPENPRWYCTFCLGGMTEAEACERIVVKPVMGVGEEVLIPAGLQYFHFDCWQKLSTGAK